MNRIGEGIQKIKECRYCQHVINEKFEKWEVKAKEAQKKFKQAEECEHFGPFDRNLYGKNKELIFEWKSKGNGRHFFCTNSCCIKADNGTRPDLVIYKVNAYGDEWEDPNHSFQKVKGSLGIEVNNIECKNCNQRERERNQPRSCSKCHQDLEKGQLSKEERNKFGNLNEHYVKNNRTGKEYTICPKCNICSYCKAKNIETITNEDNDRWKAGVWLCKNCATNATPREEDRKVVGKKRGGEEERANLQSEINILYNKPNKTVEEEQELVNKRKQNDKNLNDENRQSWTLQSLRLPGWIAGIMGGFLFILPFILLFLVIRFLWRAGSKK